MNILKLSKVIVLLICFTGFVSNIAFADEDNIVHVIDFSNVEDREAKSWLREQGYVLELNADDLSMAFKNGSLVIETEESIAGIAVLQLKEDSWLHDISYIDIEWGVYKQPDGANWELGYNKVPIALMFFFGNEYISSGLPFGINSAPYFISPFIGNREIEGKTYTGNLYKEGGRYICMALTEGKDEIIKSRLKVDPKFLKEFSKHSIPPITGVAFQMNTQDTEGGASAFIKKIEFISNNN